MLQEVETNKILEVKELSTVFSTDAGEIRAVDKVSFSLAKGKVLGIVGESGCGKTVTSLSILQLLPRTAYISAGEIFFNNKDLLKLTADEMRTIRGNHIALIPQDPMTSLNPVYTIGNQMLEVITLHQGIEKLEARNRAIEALEQVKIAIPSRLLENYPHELSGGMRQRVIIAMALSSRPEILIADEPTTALDVTVQAQILNLIRNIQQQAGMALLLITHDLGVIAEMCQDVIVMYAGQIVEYASVYSLYDDPLHPYTISLLKSLPVKQKKRLEQIEGQPPSLQTLPEGCYFEPRCPKRFPECKKVLPGLIEIPDGRKVRCLLYR